jgi:hypothetical protein
LVEENSSAKVFLHFETHETRVLSTKCLLERSTDTAVIRQSLPFSN